jgi:tRNA(fMet)-specific endonuclease VapC
MSFLLDTNILSSHLKTPAILMHRMIQHSGRLHTSSVCLAELYVWAFNRPNPTGLLNAIERMLLFEVLVVNFDVECAEEFGRTKLLLRRQGIVIAASDLMIAATALVRNCTMVTHNTSDFGKIPNLRIQDWLQP